MQQKVAKLVDMLKKQDIPDDMIRMFTNLVIQQQEELDLANEETLRDSLNKAVGRLLHEAFFSNLTFVNDEDNDTDDEEEREDYVSPYPKDYPKYLMRRDVKKWTIRISLQGIRPVIWRKLEVPSNRVAGVSKLAGACHLAKIGGTFQYIYDILGFRAVRGDGMGE